MTTITISGIHKQVVQLYKAGNLIEAIEVARNALASHPNYLPLVETYRKIGQSTGDIPLMLDAARCYDAASQDPIVAIESTLLADQLYCDWAKRPYMLQYLAKRYQADFPHREVNMSMLAAIDDPSLHRAIARCFTKSVAEKMRPFRSQHYDGRKHGSSQNRKLRIGYVSCDFSCHPMSRVIAEVIERHDRDIFEIFGYDYSREDGSEERKRMRAAFENFRLFGKRDFVACANLIASDRIDVLIDLKGYTRDACPEIFSLRPSPVQVSFLGYPGSLAAPWIDYVIADRHVIPAEERPHWTETMAFMPNSYYPITPLPYPLLIDDTISRASYGLPDEGEFVFGCFNNPFKITPEVFRLWMTILSEAPCSVLWLYNRMDVSQRNLKEKAVAHGIDPDRLIFCGNLPHQQHMSRYRYMDLFLDTSPYNAHTTATDSLCSGVPVLTLPGKSFASRVGLSLLKALNLDVLIAQTSEEYVRKAVELARNPERIRDVKCQVERVVEAYSVSGSVGYTRDLEKLFSAMGRLHCEGRPRSNIADLGD